MILDRDPLNLIKKITNTPDITEEIAPDTEKIRKQLDRFMLITEAMWSLLRENGYTDEALRERIGALDRTQSGTKDPQNESAYPLCPKCNQTLQKTDGVFSRCIYCGFETVGDPFDT